jgi:Acyclic terpene utilisation family protein AtuA
MSGTGITTAGHPERRGTSSRPVRIANCSGFYGDRLSALEEMVTGGAVDVVTGDYLAEVTMLILARSRLRNRDAGYANTFLRQLEPVAGEIAARGIKVVVNAGGLNPAGLARATSAMLSEIGVGLAVSYVEGDDLAGRIHELQDAGVGLANLDTGAPFSSWGHDPLTANAYLGGFGIKAALDAGADIVVTGRVADASLASGAGAWWWGWSPDDHDALAGAVVAGHVIECGAQATGGNFSGFRQIDDLTHPGFPLAEIDRDGTSVITKHEGTGGAVTVGTVTAQLLYEVGGPDYLNPDVVARLDTVKLEQRGRDRVSVTGVLGRPPTPTTKVAVTGLGEWRNSVTVVLTGLDSDAKASRLESALTSRLEKSPGVSNLRFTRIGTPDRDPVDQMMGSCLLSVAVDGDESSCGRAFSSMVVELALSNFPGIYYTEPPGNGSPIGAYWPTLVPLSEVHQTVVHHDGRRETIPAPAPTRPLEITKDENVTQTATQRAEMKGPTMVEGPLGLVVNARSGDKGGNANVGVWVDTSNAWSWLREAITAERFAELLPEAAQFPIERYELPNLYAINFVVRGLLDGGATEARRFDKQAKALGEWLRSRHVLLPAELLR